MILYIENPTDATRKLLELISEFSKVAGYKINTQKSAAFLYTNSKRSEREIKEMIPFTITVFIFFEMTEDFKSLMNLLSRKLHIDISFT